MRQPRILGMILAGGRGDRLFPLTKARSKPAVPFAGKFEREDTQLVLNKIEIIITPVIVNDQR